jgi:universal stress protein A
MTTTFNHILVPTDYGEPAKHALELAITIARKFDAKITLLNVYYYPPLPLGNPFQWPMGEISKVAHDEMEKELVAAKQAYANIEGVVRAGSPAMAILATARERDVSLIVMGTHGRQGVARLLGSVAANVVRAATVPVLTTGESASA